MAYIPPSRGSIMPPWINNQLNSPNTGMVIPSQNRFPIPQRNTIPNTAPNMINPGAIQGRMPIVPPGNMPANNMMPPANNGDDNNSNSVMSTLMAQLNSSNAASQQNYNSLMSNFNNALNQPMTGYTPYNPVEQTYNRTKELSNSFGNLENLVKTGGYSDDDVSNIRERGISPIRSIYANAMRNLDRQKSIQGGYSPGFGAVNARMARELSDTISGKTSDVNANIAEMVAAGKGRGISGLSELSGRENELQSNIQRGNVEAKNKASEYNRNMQLQTETAHKNRQAELLKSMTSLYGTTPGLAEVFGRQALSGAELSQRINEAQRSGKLDLRKLEQQGGLGLIDAYIRSLGR